jgi:hypothetical protein
VLPGRARAAAADRNEQESAAFGHAGTVQAKPIIGANLGVE